MKVFIKAESVHSAGQNFGPIYCRLIRIALACMNENEESIISFFETLMDDKNARNGTYLLGFTSNTLTVVHQPFVLRNRIMEMEDNRIAALFDMPNSQVWAVGVLDDKTGTLCQVSAESN